MGAQTTVSTQELQPSAQQTADGTSANTANTSAAKTLEIWVIVTAINAATTFDVPVEASPDGTNFDEVGRISGIAATGTFKLALARAAQDPLGTSVRAKFDLSGAVLDATFSILALIKE
jgi:hypothetical protein